MKIHWSKKTWCKSYSIWILV